MRNKIIDMYQSGKGQSHFLGFGTSASHGQSLYPQIEKTCNSGEPSQEWPACQN